MNLTLILDELALVVAFPERAEHGFIRECVVLADERLQVPSRLRAVVCVNVNRLRIRTDRSERSVRRIRNLQNGILGKNCQVEGD